MVRRASNKDEYMRRRRDAEAKKKAVNALFDLFSFFIFFITPFVSNFLCVVIATLAFFFLLSMHPHCNNKKEHRPSQKVREKLGAEKRACYQFYIVWKRKS